MSAFIGEAVGAARAGLAQLGITPLFTDWRSRLMLPASFRGVPFQVRAHTETGGRRAAVHEFPLRDIPATEDLGSAARRYTIDGYLVGDDYDLNRDALRAALFDQVGPGTLVHPYLGVLTVQPIEGCTFNETVATGRMATFRLACVQAGDVSQSRAAVDTTVGVLNGVASVINDLKAFYTLGVLVATHPGFLMQALTGGLENLAGSLLGLPPGFVQGLAGVINGIFAAPFDTVGTPAAIAAAFQAVGDGLVATPPAGDDPTGGLAALSTWSGGVQPILTATTALQQQAANAAALNYVAQGMVVATTAAVYAQTDFLSAAAAAAARATIIAMLDAITEPAADIGDVQGYNAWLALSGAVAADLLARGQALPQMGGYSVNLSLTSLVLAQRLYADQASGDRADQLMQLNDCLHPLFLPPAGVWLEAA